MSSQRRTSISSKFLQSKSCGSECDANDSGNNSLEPKLPEDYLPFDVIDTSNLSYNDVNSSTDATPLSSTENLPFSDSSNLNAGGGDLTSFQKVDKYGRCWKSSIETSIEDIESSTDEAEEHIDINKDINEGNSGKHANSFQCFSNSPKSKVEFVNSHEDSENNLEDSIISESNCQVVRIKDIIGKVVAEKNSEPDRFTEESDCKYYATDSKSTSETEGDTLTETETECDFQSSYLTEHEFDNETDCTTDYDANQSISSSISTLVPSSSGTSNREYNLCSNNQIYKSHSSSETPGGGLLYLSNLDSSSRSTYLQQPFEKSTLQGNYTTQLNIQYVSTLSIQHYQSNANIQIRDEEDSQEDTQDESQDELGSQTQDESQDEEAFQTQDDSQDETQDETADDRESYTQDESQEEPEEVYHEDLQNSQTDLGSEASDNDAQGLETSQAESETDNERECSQSPSVSQLNLKYSHSQTKTEAVTSSKTSKVRITSQNAHGIFWNKKYSHVKPKVDSNNSSPCSKSMVNLSCRKSEIEIVRTDNRKKDSANIKNRKNRSYERVTKCQFGEVEVERTKKLKPKKEKEIPQKREKEMPEKKRNKHDATK